MKDDPLIKDAKAGDLNFFCGVLDDKNVIAEGGCGKTVNVLEAYRCGDCTVYFHRACLRSHFNQESVDAVRSALNMDEWQPVVESLSKEGKEKYMVGLVFNLLEEARKGTLKKTP